MGEAKRVEEHEDGLPGELALVLLNGETFVGRHIVVDGEPKLAHALKFEAIVLPQPGGRVATLHRAAPLLLLPSLETIPVRGGHVVFVYELAPSDQKTVKAAVRHGEELRRQMRAADAGILVEPPRGGLVRG